MELALATLGASALAYFLHEILARFSAYRELYKHHAFYVPEGIDKIGGVILCALLYGRSGEWVGRKSRANSG